MSLMNWPSLVGGLRVIGLHVRVAGAGSRTKCFRQRSRVAAILSLLVAKVDPMIEIVAGDHLPDLPFVIVDRQAATSI